ncbi:hypothetical protein [Pseudomonas ficuserectae]|uniref:hypothetical protein n=1 Tax=Pseudomonas ficuserectae TaxID=53410 RepID=UPI0006E5C1B1|nr:hypothetical protein [Pseudomonas ficuserectae]KPX33052.1 hypothetical protein ALO69_200073 [Pseudomonas ficuserectae]
MRIQKLAFGLFASILSVSSIQAFAADDVEASPTQQEVFLEHVNSVVSEPVYQNDESGVTVYAAPEPAPITINK